MNGESSIHQAVRAKDPLNVNLKRISHNQALTAPVRLFWVDPALIMAVVNARFGSVIKENAGDDITT